MLRDTRKTAGYFEEYIACQMERIQKFEDVLRNLGAGDTAKNMQCHMYLPTSTRICCWRNTPPAAAPAC